MTKAATERRETNVSLRIKPQTKALIESAASAVNQSFSAFVVESASRSAVDVLLDQRVFHLSGEAADSFAAILDSPPPPTDRLRKLMRSRAPWEA